MLQSSLLETLKVSVEIKCMCCCTLNVNVCMLSVQERVVSLLDYISSSKRKKKNNCVVNGLFPLYSLWLTNLWHNVLKNLFCAVLWSLQLQLLKEQHNGGSTFLRVAEREGMKIFEMWKPPSASVAMCNPRPEMKYYLVHFRYCFMRFIGASLSKPHICMTTLHTHVCIYACLDRPLTVNFKSAHSNISTSHLQCS